MTQIKIKRVYEAPEKSDGYRVLVDKLWPRGMKKEYLKHDVWEKNIAPSAQLRSWFHADTDSRWDDFVVMYCNELNHSDAVDQFIDQMQQYNTVTLLYASQNPMHNHARILQHFLETKRQTRKAKQKRSTQD